MLKLKGGNKMLNEKIVKNEKLRERRLVELFDKGIIEIGDEIPYKHERKSYLSPVHKNGVIDQYFSTESLEVKWQAIGIERISGRRCLKLIMKQPVFEFELSGAEGCEYGIGELDKISQIFATEVVTLKARNVTIEDINKLLDIVVDKENHRIYQKKNSMEDINWYEDFLTIFNMKRHYTPGSYLKNEYASSDEIIQTCYSYNKDDILGKEKEIIFLDKPYWLSSKGTYVVNNMDRAYYGPGVVYRNVTCAGGSNIFGSHGECIKRNYGIRTILYLSHDITLNALLKMIQRENLANFQNLLGKLKAKRHEEEEIIKEMEQLIKSV